MKHTFFPLAKAYLCVNCQAVSNQSRNCPVCESSSILSLARVLDHTDEPTVTPERVDAALRAMEAGM